MDRLSAENTDRHTDRFDFRPGPARKASFFPSAPFRAF